MIVVMMGCCCDSIPVGPTFSTTSGPLLSLSLVCSHAGACDRSMTVAPSSRESTILQQKKALTPKPSCEHRRIQIWMAGFLLSHFGTKNTTLIHFSDIFCDNR